MVDLHWPDKWQAEAVAAALPYIGTDDRLDILVDEPTDAMAGTRIAGHLYRGDDGAVMMIYDRSGRPGIFPWRLLSGPVLVIKLLRPGRRSKELYRHPLWP